MPAAVHTVCISALLGVRTPVHTITPPSLHAFTPSHHQTFRFSHAPSRPSRPSSMTLSFLAKQRRSSSQGPKNGRVPRHQQSAAAPHLLAYLLTYLSQSGSCCTHPQALRGMRITRSRRLGPLTWVWACYRCEVLVDHLHITFTSTKLHAFTPPDSHLHIDARCWWARASRAHRRATAATLGERLMCPGVAPQDKEYANEHCAAEARCHRSRDNADKD